MKKILQKYKNMTFDIFSDASDIDDCRSAYNNIQLYYKGIISFEELMVKVDSICPPNSCNWCNDNCDKCDIAERDQHNNIKGGNCEECWKRCLEQEI